MTVVEEVNHAQDIASAKKFHGDQLLYNEDGLVEKLRSKDAGMQKHAVSSYLDKFKEEATADDRRGSYAELVNQYYDLVTDFYEYGWGQSFHFCPFYKGEAFDMAIARHEHFLSSTLALTPGMKVLDVGCGVGGPMRQIARFSGATITGINNNAYQVDRVNYFNKKTGLDKVASAVKGDFMNMPFEDNTFDAVYAIEATVHAPTLAGVLKEVYRVLKPGGVYASYEWLCTNKYDESDPEQKHIIKQIEEGDGISKMPTVKECLADIEASGFELEFYKDLAEYDPRYEDPWYSTLEGSFSLSGFRMTRLGRSVTDKLVRALETVGLAPKGSHDVSQLLCRAADGLVEGGKNKLFTPMFLYKLRKPLDAAAEEVAKSEE